jgi:F-type H+-transporting ATPase subunit epsilon
MQVSIYSLKGTAFEGQAESVTCKTTSGEITILNNHHPLITVLAPGVITIVDKNKEKGYFNVSSGFVEVQGDHTSIIVEEV